MFLCFLSGALFAIVMLGLFSWYVVPELRAIAKKDTPPATVGEQIYGRLR